MSARVSGASEGDGVEAKPKKPNGIEFCCLPFTVKQSGRSSQMSDPIEQSSSRAGSNCGATAELLAEPGFDICVEPL